jgi:glutaryl-CoA dehydrogenase (non-decarboxylating)
MKIGLTAKQKEDQAAFRAFVDEQIVPHADRYDHEECIPSELIAKLAQRRYLGATLPEEYGGCGMDMITYGLLNEELGRGCSSVRSLVTVQNMIAQTILKWGSKHQKELWLNKMSSGDAIAAFALTEPDVGSDARNIETTVTFAGDSYVLNGHKKWITFGQIADLFLIFGQCDGRPCAFLIEKGTPGLSMEPIFGMLGVRASMLAELHLNDCQIPRENLVGGVGFGFVPVALFALDIGRYSVAWGCVGIAQACLEGCVQYAGERKQFGVYLKEHQLIRQMITDMIVNVKAAKLLCYQAGYLKELGDPNSVMETLVAKYFASTMATRAANDAVQIHGALGCSSAHAVQRYLRDAKIMEIIEGTTQIHQIKIAEYGCQGRRS